MFLISPAVIIFEVSLSLYLILALFEVNNTNTKIQYEQEVQLQ